MSASVVTPPAPGIVGRIAGYAQDVGLMLLVILMIPATILLIGGPVALLIRAVIEVVRRFSS